MEKIDDLINFLWNRRTDDRVTITKDKNMDGEIIISI